MKTFYALVEQPNPGILNILFTSYDQKECEERQKVHQNAGIWVHEARKNRMIVPPIGGNRVQYGGEEATS